MTEMPACGCLNQKSDHIALLKYVADQLRCYSDEHMNDNDTLTTFADLLDGLSIELESTQSYTKLPNGELIVSYD